MSESVESSEAGVSTGAADRQDLFDAVVHDSPDGIVVMDNTGTIQYVNPASEVLFDRTHTVLQGKPFGYPVMSGKTTDIEVLRPGKPPKVVQMRVANIRWEGRSGLLATLRDISESIRLTNELKRSNRDLEEFASVISHDIRAPLRNVSLLASWLATDHSSDLNEEALDDIALMRKTTDRMSSMVEDLLSYCRVASSKKVTKGVSLDEVLSDAIDALQEEIFKKDTQIVKDPLPSIDCNIAQMVTLFKNILANAIAYCPIKPKIVISAEGEDDMVLIRVSDNGIGIEEKFWDDVFLPFKHLYSKETHEGSGIGLATCKKIVELHNGLIWLTSEPGVGSVVHVRLPIKKSVDWLDVTKRTTE